MHSWALVSLGFPTMEFFALLYIGKRTFAVCLCRFVCLVLLTLLSDASGDGLTIQKSQHSGKEASLQAFLIAEINTELREGFWWGRCVVSPRTRSTSKGGEA